MEIIPCDYCGSSDRYTLYDISDWPWVDQTLGIALVVCINCGLLYLCPRPDKNEIQDKIYWNTTKSSQISFVQ